VICTRTSILHGCTQFSTLSDSSNTFQRRNIALDEWYWLRRYSFVQQVPDVPNQLFKESPPSCLATGRSPAIKDQIRHKIRSRTLICGCYSVYCKLVGLSKQVSCFQIAPLAFCTSRIIIETILAYTSCFRTKRVSICIIRRFSPRSQKD